MVLCLVVHFVLLAISFAVYKSPKRLLVLYNLVWSVFILISVIGFDGINKASEYIYSYFLIGSCFFNLFAYIFDFVFFKNTVNEKKINICQYSIGFSKKQRKVVLFLGIVTLIYFSFKSIGVFRGLLNGSLLYSQVRNIYYSASFFSSDYEYLLVMYFFDPLVVLFGVLFVVNFFNKSMNVLYNIVFLTNVALRTFVSGGRMFLFELAFLLIVGFVIFYRKKNKGGIGFFKFLLFAFIGLLLAYFAVLISTERGRSGSFFEQIREMIVVNFTGSYTFMDVLLSGDMMLNHTYGTSLIAGFLDPIITFLRFFGITDIEALNVSIGRIISKFYMIGDTYSYNAMPTMYYFFLTDFGVFGLVLGPLFFSWIVSITEKGIFKRYDVSSFVCYFLVALLIIESSMTWLLFKTSFALIFLYVLIISKIGVERRENNFCNSSKLQQRKVSREVLE